MKISYHPRAPTPEHVDEVWYHESAPKLTWELPGPRIVAIEHAEQSREQDAPAGAGALRRGGAAMERVIERCCGLDVHKKTVVACVPDQRARAARADVRHDHGGAAGVAGLAGWVWRYPRGDGEHGGLLETDLLCARGRGHVCAGQRRADRPSAGAEDGRQGLRLDRPAAGAWARAGQLCAARADPRTPRSHALSRRVDRRAHS